MYGVRVSLSLFGSPNSLVTLLSLSYGDFMFAVNSKMYRGRY
jgi:hypothetical protein